MRSKTGMPLEEDVLAFTYWLRTQRIRGSNWRIAKIDADGYLINEYGDIRRADNFKLIRPYISNKGYKVIDL